MTSLPAPVGEEKQKHPVVTAETCGLALSGLSPDGRLLELIELPGHSLVCGVPVPSGAEVHPNRTQPLFREFSGPQK